MNATTAILIWSVLYVSLGANLYLWNERPEFSDLKERAARERLIEVFLGAFVVMPFCLLVIAVRAYRALRAALTAG